MTENHISLQSWHLSLFFVGPGLLCCMAIEKKWFSFFLTWNNLTITNQQRTTEAHPSKFKCISTEELSFLLPDFGQHPVFNYHDALFIFSDLLGKPTKTSCISNFILLHYMFQPSGPDHMLNKTGTVLKWFPPSSLPRKWKSIQNWKY